MNDLVTVAFLAVFVVVVGNVILRIRKSGGLKGAMFGGPISRTVGEVDATSRSPVKSVIRVHVLGNGSDGGVGVELVAKSFASFQMMPVTLSTESARALASLLLAAAEDPRSARRER